MSDALPTYLHDHLAGSNFAVDLLKNFCSRHAGTPLGEFGTDMLAEIEEDQQVLHNLIDRVGVPSPALKEAAAWVSEKASRLKLGSGSGELGTFQTLETLAMGIWGKRALWRALGVIAGADSRIQIVDFSALSERAEAQHARVEERRVQVARTALVAAT